MTEKSKSSHKSALLQAFLAIEELEAELKAAEEAKREPIAIIGLGCRFPGAPDPQSFWELLRDGVDATREVPKERWDIDAYYDPDPDTPGKMYVRRGAFLDKKTIPWGIESFDAHFFHISPREAVSLDPQQRLLLEVSWEAIENANITASQLRNSNTGVYIGHDRINSEYALLDPSRLKEDRYLESGTSASFPAGRLSYFLGLQGPSLVVSTACSSSLVATHLAIQALRAKECDLVLAGGVQLNLSPENSILLSKTNALAPDGRCKTFDAAADGYSRGEGCGIIVLKRLSDAVRDGDFIRAVIRGSAINHDGPSAGLTVPNGPAQEKLLRQALASANVDPAQISYVEAHGTGTPLGDPIEVRALGKVMGQGLSRGTRDRQNPLLIGSVKTNIGHLESAAGIAGLLKVVLSLEHGEIPPHLHFKTPNPNIRWDDLPIKVPTKRTPWPSPLELGGTGGGQGGRLAGVSSFGFSGTNAHVILEQAPPDESDRGTATKRPIELLTLSAKTAGALKTLANRYVTALATTPSNLANICFTANSGRTDFIHRLSVIGHSKDEISQKLASFAAGQEVSNLFSGQAIKGMRSKIAFLFTGQGSQYVGMGRELYESQPTFRQALEQCDEYLRQFGVPLLSVLYPVGEESPLNQTAYTQPALFAIEYALAQLWRSYGIEPDVVMGHSVGEYVAACVAGVFSLEDGLKLIAERGRLMQALPQNGEMVSVMASHEQVAALISERQVAIAAINGPKSIVISGERQAVRNVVALLSGQGIKSKTLSVSHAFHSSLMEPMQERFAQVAREISYSQPQIDIVSNLTGGLVSDEIANPSYWVRHVRQPVRFADGMASLDSQGIDIFLEIGPKPILLGMGQLCLPDAGGTLRQAQGTAWLPSLRPNKAWPQMLSSLGQLYVRGATVNWNGFDKEYVKAHHKVVLPTYPFQRERYWIERRVETTKRVRPLLDKMIKSALHKATIFETEFSIQNFPFLNDHQVYNTVVSPGACHLAMVLSAAEVMSGSASCVLEDVIFPQALVLPEEGKRTVQVVFTPTDGATSEFQLISFATDDEILTHATGRVIAQSGGKTRPMSLGKLRESCPTEIASESLYQAAAEQQIIFGPTFRWLHRVWVGDGQAVAQLERPQAVDGLQGYLFHPGLLDACVQTTGASEQESDQTALPFAIRRVCVHQQAKGRAWWCFSQQKGENKSDIYLLDKNGEVLVELLDFEVRAAPREAFELAPSWQDWLYTVSWQARPQFGLLPDYLPVPQQFNDALIAQFSAQAAQLDWPHLVQAEEQLEAISMTYVLSALSKLGFVWEPGLRLRSEPLMAQLTIIPSYKRLFERLLSMLAEGGILKQDGSRWLVVRKPPHAELPVVTDEATAALRLLKRCGEKLAQVLRGTQEPLELLFPNGDASLVEELYQDAPASQLMNQLVQQAVQTALEQLPDGQGIRILEVGAGTGGTTSYLLPHLPAERTEYLFTDIGRAFIIQAQEKFSEYDFVEYKLLDIEQEPISQGFAPQQYDLVIAANVLHATQDLSQTLSHIQQLLKPKGALLLLESTSRQKWVDLTFGLTEGWWRFSDVDIRPDHPLLSTKQWQEVLLNSGFQAVTYLPEENSTHEKLGGTLLYAQADTAKKGRQWLLLADEAGYAEALAARLQAWGEQPKLVWAGDEYEQLNEHTFKINPYDSTDYQRLLQATSNISGVVHLWSLDQPPTLSTADLESAAQRSCGTTLLLVQTMLQTNASPPALWLVTQGAQAVVKQDQVNGVEQATLWGMGRTIALEHPELNCVCLDLDPQMSHKAQGELLCAEIMATSHARYEPQVALRQDRRLVARLSRYQEQTAFSEPFRLQITERGTLDNMQLRPVARRAPARGEVEIRVRATGLNFIDVLDVLGLLPFERDKDELGGESAGEIVAVGDGVDDYQVGDRVLTMAAGCFSQYITMSSEGVVPLPKALSFEEGATIPVTFLTSHYALHHVANISAGDRVLIHAAAGGTGMAAVQIAQQAGAEVFGTASSPKWEMLKSLGVKHIYNSRTLDFADQVMADTDGQGVDIVLNSLTGEGFIEKSLSVLAPNGRFVEIAKRDIWTQGEVNASRKDVGYHFVDLQQQTPQESYAMLCELLPQFKAGTLKPLPHTEFAIEDVVSAFRYMQQAKHIGKIVVTQKQPVTDHDNGTYLITGGLGGLGLKVAHWLIHEGARHLMLMGRSQPKPEVQRQLESLRKLGAEITVVQADVSNSEQVKKALAQIELAHPLRGIIHSVGVLDDGAVTKLSWQRFMKVLAPKICGAWNLHQLTEQMPLDFFVLFSSVAGLFGSRGQANHAAANTFLDAFAHYRAQQNLPALSIAWGAWSEIGAAAQMVGHFETQGELIIEPEQGIEVFAHLLPKDVPLVAVSPMNWKQYLSRGVNPFFETFALVPKDAEKAVIEQVSFRQKLTQAPVEERNALMMQNLQTLTAKVLGWRVAEQIPSDDALMTLGLDSLMAIELRNQLARTLEHPLPSTLLFNYSTINSLAEYLLSQVLELSPADTVIREESELELPSQDTIEEADLDSLSEAEMAALLNKEISE